MLTLQHVTIGYDRRTILSDVNLHIAAGDCLRIGGGNGGGKTTLLRLLAGLLAPQSGKVLRHRPCVTGYLPQYRRIDREFPLTVAQVVCSGLHCRKSLLRPFGRDDRRRVGEMLERFGIADLGERSIRELSGGQWQRTLLARALVGNPDLLLLDEPDTHLDEEGKTFLRHLLETEAGQRTIVLVSHEPAFLPAVPGLRTLTAGGGTVVEA